MSRAVTSKQHECSCGRSFRHKVSLVRHREASGCAPLVEAPDTENPDRPAPSPASNFTPRTRNRREYPEAPKAHRTPTLVPPETMVSSVVAAPAPAPGPSRPLIQIDWAALAVSAMALAGAVYDCRHAMVRSAHGFCRVASRFALFLAVVVLGGWFIVSTTAAEREATRVSNVSRARQMAARTTVETFLQSASLNQFGRAWGLLAPDARATVSAGDLQAMLTGLPLSQTPESWQSELLEQGQKARVTIRRGGAAEVYTLVSHNQGWGLASVAVTTTRS